MQLIDRMIRAARLDPQLYEEVEHDATALPQAMMVVIISSVAGGVGMGLSGFGQTSDMPLVAGLIIGTIGNLVGWFMWAGLTYFIGTTLFKGPDTSSSMGELLRVIGFASSPGVLRLFVFVPVFGPIILFGAGVWTLVAMVIAVRQALDFTTRRAIGTCLVGWFAIVAMFMLLYRPT